MGRREKNEGTLESEGILRKLTKTKTKTKKRLDRKHIRLKINPTKF